MESKGKKKKGHEEPGGKTGKQSILKVLLSRDEAGW